MQPAVAAADNQSAITTADPNPLAGTGLFLWTFRACVCGALLIAFVLGGPVIRLGAAAAALLALLADHAGGIRHLLHLGCLPLCLVAVGWWGRSVGAWIARWIDIPPPLAMLVAVGVIFVVGLTMTGALGRGLTRRLRKRRYLYVLNRTGGCVLGIFEGGLLAVTLTWVLGIFGPALFLNWQALSITHPKLGRILGYVYSVRAALHDDETGRWLEDHNPLEKVPAVVTVAALGEVAADHELFWQLVRDGTLEELLEVPVIRQHYNTIRSDPTLRQYIEERDLAALLRSKQFADALNDNELCREIAKRWPELRARIGDQEVRRAQSLADDLEPEARAKYDRAVRRARAFGVEMP